MYYMCSILLDHTERREEATTNHADTDHPQSCGVMVMEDRALVET